MTKTILVYNGKGGVGKSTYAILLAEWIEFKGYSVNLEDASGNPTAHEFIAGCQQLGRANVHSNRNPEFRIIDTKGTHMSAAEFFNEATTILIPFEPKPASVNETESTFDDHLAEGHQHKVVFIANMLRPVATPKTARDCLDSVKELADEEGLPFIYGLTQRDSVFPTITMGLPKNFFELDTSGNTPRDVQWGKAQAECDEIFTSLAKHIDEGLFNGHHTPIRVQA